jgi:hypothetical protein
MVTHYWGDPDVDWAGIDAAAAYIGQGLRRWGRVDVHQTKEKFGTVRVYCTLGFHMFHQIIWPGFVYNQYPWKWLWRLDCTLYPVWRRIDPLIAPFHCWLYRWFYKSAIRRWPHLRAEITDGADYPKLLGGL